MTNEYSVNGQTASIWLARRDGSVWECRIDLADLPIVQAYPGKFYACWSSDCQTFYALGRFQGQNILMHRLLTNAPKGAEVDHGNHNGLDNRRSMNLKVCGRSENALNRRGANVTSRSGARNVYWRANKRRWAVQVMWGGKRRQCGTYRTIEEAEAVAEQARRGIFTLRKTGRPAA